MNRSRFIMATILTALMGNGGCAPKSDLIRLPVREVPVAEPTSGYLKIGEQQEQIAYFEHDGVAILDECARVPLKAVTPEPIASMNLTTHVGVGLWPQAIVPYVIDGAPADFHENFMRVAIDQYRRAGILLVPRTNETHYVKIKFLVKNTPSCQSLGCDSYVAAANSYGFASKSNPNWLYFDKSPIHDGNTVFLTCKSANCDEYTFNIKSHIKSKLKPPKKVAKAKKNGGILSGKIPCTPFFMNLDMSWVLGMNTPILMHLKQLPHCQTLVLNLVVYQSAHSMFTQSCCTAIVFEKSILKGRQYAT